MLPCKYQTGDFLGGTLDKEKRRKIVTEDYVYCDRFYHSSIKLVFLGLSGEEKQVRGRKGKNQ